MNVELVAHHGDDLLVVDAARVSFGKKSAWEWWDADGRGPCDSPSPCGSYFSIKKMAEKDVKLINYLAREKHVLPFRHPQITLRCKAPIFLARQLGKHQVGMSWSEESRRYIDSEPEFFWPDKWRKRAENVKQGSSDEVVEKIMCKKYDTELRHPTQESAELVLADCVNLYESMLDSGVAPELARMVLPQNMYINWVWTGSLLSFFEMYKLRSEAHAQVEAQQFAQLVKDVVSNLYPVSWSALEEHQ
jgi:thymidylate synthase (FAD)